MKMANKKPIKKFTHISEITNKKATILFKGKEYEFGTRRERTELDDILDQIILEDYYKAHDEEKTPEKDKEILFKTYIRPKRT